MSSIIGQIELEHPELFALEFGKMAESDFIYTLASTNINQLASNVLKMYVTIRSPTSSIMDSIGPELSELFAIEFEKLLNLTVYTLASEILTNQYQTWPQYNYYMPIRSWMSSIKGQIEPVHLELFALEFGKMTESDFVYTLASTNINQSAPNLVKM